MAENARSVFLNYSARIGIAHFYCYCMSRKTSKNFYFISVRRIKILIYEMLKIYIAIIIKLAPAITRYLTQVLF